MNHSSYKEYVDQVISVVPEEMDQEFIDLLKEEINPLAEKFWTEHLIGERDTYQLSDDDIELVWKNATIKMIENTLAKLSDFGLIDALVNKGGEIAYKISEDGEDYVKNVLKE